MQNSAEDVACLHEQHLLLNFIGRSPRTRRSEAESRLQHGGWLEKRTFKTCKLESKAIRVCAWFI